MTTWGVQNVEQPQINGKWSFSHELQDSILLWCQYYPKNLYIQCNPYQNFKRVFAYTEKPILKFIQNLKGPWIAKIILETAAIPSHISWFQDLL